MDALELLHGDAPFVADTSAWWRALTLPGDLAELLQNAVRSERILLTPIVRMAWPSRTWSLSTASYISDTRR